MKKCMEYRVEGRRPVYVLMYILFFAGLFK